MLRHKSGLLNQTRYVKKLNNADHIRDLTRLFNKRILGLLDPEYEATNLRNVYS